MNAATLTARLGAGRWRERLVRLVGRGKDADAGAAVPVRDWINVGTGAPPRLMAFDQALVWVVVGLLALGLVMVYSASVALPDSPKFARYAHTHFLTRHAMQIGLAVLAALLVVQVPVASWEKAAPWLFVTALVLLVLVLLPFIDTTPDQPDTPDDDPTRDPADPCARPEIIYRFPRLVLAYAFKVWGFALALLLPQQPYRAIGGIHLRAGCERVRLLENKVIGGAGNGITLGGDLDPPPPAPEPQPVLTIATSAVAVASVNTASLSASAAASLRVPTAASVASAASRLSTNAATSDQPVAVVVDASGQFLALVLDEAGAAQADVDVYLEATSADAGTASDRSDKDGLASIKTAPGRCLLDVSPQWRIVRVAETRDQGVLVNAITIAPRAAARGRAEAFLHEVTIEANDVSMMGLSGIGFALRAGARLAGTTTAVVNNNAKATLLAFIDNALLNFALTPLLRATHPVRDLVILNNRLHHNLRNPFTEAMLQQAQQIGHGADRLRPRRVQFHAEGVFHGHQQLQPVERVAEVGDRRAGMDGLRGQPQLALDERAGGRSDRQEGRFQGRSQEGRSQGRRPKGRRPKGRERR